MNKALKPIYLNPLEVKILENASAKELVKSAMAIFGDRLALSSSFQMEESVLIHLMAESGYPIHVFGIDTGYLHAETIQTAEALEKRYKFKTTWFKPDPEEVKSMINTQGVNSFYLYGHENCCRICKVNPLQNALEHLNGWITGLRKEQNPNSRSEFKSVERNQPREGITKFNPLIDWTKDQVWDFIHENQIPYNRLYDLGYKSIGCAPCTKPVLPFEDDRAGRWWWENKKECGLHLNNGAGI